MGKINPGKKTLGRMELIKADRKKPRGRENVANVKQDPKDGGRLGTRKVTGVKVGDVVGRSSKTGELRTRKNTNLSKFPKPRPTIPTPVGIAAALAPIAYEQTSKQQTAGSDSMGKTMSTRRKDTVRDIQGTPAEIAADKKRAVAKKKREAAAKKKREAAAKKKREAAVKAKKVPKPKRKPKVPTSTEKSSNPEVYVDSSVTYDMDNMPKKMSGGKVNYRKAGGKIGRGCGAAQRGGGKVMI